MKGGSGDIQLQDAAYQLLYFSKEHFLCEDLAMVGDDVDVVEDGEVRCEDNGEKMGQREAGKEILEME